MTSTFSHSMLRVAVAQIAQQLGWNAIQSTPMELLTDILEKYIFELGRYTHRYSEQFGRTEPNLDDLGLAFQEMGINMDEIVDYVKCVDPLPFPKEVPKYPVGRPNHLHFPHPGCREVTERDEHIPEYLPAMHPESEEELLNTSQGASTPPHAAGTPQGAPEFGMQVSPGAATGLPGEKRSFGIAPDSAQAAKRQRLLPEEAAPSNYKMAGITMSASGILTPIKGQGTLPDSKLLPSTPTAGPSGLSAPLPMPGPPTASSTPRPPPLSSRASVTSETIAERTVLEGYGDANGLARQPSIDQGDGIPPLSLTPPSGGRAPPKMPARNKSPKLVKPKVKAKAGSSSPKVKQPGQAKSKSPMASHSPKPGHQLKELLVTKDGSGPSVKSETLRDEWEYEDLTFLADPEDDTRLVINSEGGQGPDTLEQRQQRLDSYNDTIAGVVRESVEMMDMADRVAQQFSLPPDSSVVRAAMPKLNAEEKAKLKLEREARIDSTIDDVIAGISVGVSEEEAPILPAIAAGTGLPVAAIKEAKPAEEPVPQPPEPKDVYTFDDFDTPVVPGPVKTMPSEKKAKLKTVPGEQKAKLKIVPSEKKVKSKTVPSEQKVKSKTVPSEQKAKSKTVPSEKKGKSKTVAGQQKPKPKILPSEEKVKSKKDAKPKVKKKKVGSSNENTAAKPDQDGMKKEVAVPAAPPCEQVQDKVVPGLAVKLLIQPLRITGALTSSPTVQQYSMEHKHEKKKKKKKSKDRDKDKSGEKKAKKEKTREEKEKRKKEKRERKEREKALAEGQRIVPKLKLKLGGVSASPSVSVSTLDSPLASPTHLSPVVRLSPVKIPPKAPASPRKLPEGEPQPACIATPRESISPLPSPTHSSPARSTSPGHRSPSPYRSPSVSPHGFSPGHRSFSSGQRSRSCSPDLRLQREGGASPSPYRSPSISPVRDVLHSPSPHLASPASHHSVSPHNNYSSASHAHTLSPSSLLSAAHRPPVGSSPTPEKASTSHPEDDELRLLIPNLTPESCSSASLSPLSKSPDREISPPSFQASLASPVLARRPSRGRGRGGKRRSSTGRSPRGRSPKGAKGFSFEDQSLSPISPPHKGRSSSKTTPSPKKVSPASGKKPVLVSSESEAETVTPGVLTETQGTVKDEHGETVWICPACKYPDDGTPMIGCDTCNDWYHWVCVGIKSEPPEDEQWYCPRCTAIKAKAQRDEREQREKQEIESKRVSSDQKVCPTCKVPYGELDSPMIGCDSCDDWYHWGCQGIETEPPEDEQWYCPPCNAARASKKKKQKKTVKKKKKKPSIS